MANIQILEETDMKYDFIHSAPKPWQIEITNALAKMQDANKDQFLIEALDHLDALRDNLATESDLQRSILHRIQLYQNNRMTAVPPMLIQRPGESDAQHESREFAAGGFVRCESICKADAAKSTKTVDVETTKTETQSQMELF